MSLLLWGPRSLAIRNEHLGVLPFAAVLLAAPHVSVAHAAEPAATEAAPIEAAEAQAAPTETSDANDAAASASEGAQAQAEGVTVTDPDERIGMWGRPVRRRGFHFQISFGIGGGPDTSGLFHSMEIGYTFKQHTIAMLHTFIQNKGILGTDDSEPDLIGGWMLEYKHPIFFPDVVGKVALGLGGIHEQDGGIKAHGGFGASYGVDWHFPVTRRFGPTLTLAGMNVTALGKHHFGVGLGLGITVF